MISVFVCGIQEYRNTGIQEYRNTGIQEYRNTFTLKPLSIFGRGFFVCVLFFLGVLVAYFEAYCMK
jgi:hypothetical protein